MNDLTTSTPKRKRQPTAEVMREQLRLAADEIIRLKTLLDGRHAVKIHSMWPGQLTRSQCDAIAARFRPQMVQLPAVQPWWRRIFRGSK